MIQSNTRAAHCRVTGANRTDYYDTGESDERKTSAAARFTLTTVCLTYVNQKTTYSYHNKILEPKFDDLCIWIAYTLSIHLDYTVLAMHICPSNINETGRFL